MANKERNTINNPSNPSRKIAIGAGILFVFVAVVVVILWNKSNNNLPEETRNIDSTEVISSRFSDYLSCINLKMDSVAAFADSTTKRNIPFFLEQKKILIDSSFAIEYRSKADLMDINQLNALIGEYQKNLDTLFMEHQLNPVNCQR